MRVPSYAISIKFHYFNDINRFGSKAGDNFAPRKVSKSVAF